MGGTRYPGKTYQLACQYEQAYTSILYDLLIMRWCACEAVSSQVELVRICRVLSKVVALILDGDDVRVSSVILLTNKLYSQAMRCGSEGEKRQRRRYPTLAFVFMRAF